MKNGHIVYNSVINPDIESLIKSRPEFKGAKEKIKELWEYIHPIVYWADFSLKVCEEGSVVLGDNLLTINSFYVAKGLKGHTGGTLAAATIGYALPRYSQVCMERGKLWEGTIADMLGSFAVESVVDRFYSSIGKAKKKDGLYPSLRFSPGYGDWSLREQPRLLELLKTGPDIKTGPGCLLEPVKSVTALLGWSPEQKSGTYPVGNRGKGLCKGEGSCSNCSTWICMKNDMQI